jgi:hypothetical protein
MTSTARLWGAMSELAESRGLHERMVTALYSAAVGHLRRTAYAKDEDLSPAADRHRADLVPVAVPNQQMWRIGPALTFDQTVSLLAYRHLEASDQPRLEACVGQPGLQIAKPLFVRRVRVALRVAWLLGAAHGWTRRIRLPKVQEIRVLTRERCSIGTTAVSTIHSGTPIVPASLVGNIAETTADIG